jgi:hypothetical protein
MCATTGARNQSDAPPDGMMAKPGGCGAVAPVVATSRFWFEEVP